MADFFKDLFGKAATKAVQSVAPKITQALPAQVQSLMKPEQLASVAKSVGANLMPDSSGRIDPDAEAASLGISRYDYDNLDTDALNRLKASKSSGPSWWNDLITDDPNSGWYDNWQNEKAEKSRIQSILNSGGMSPADLKRADDAALMVQNATPSAFDGIKNAFGGALKKIASPVGLETTAGVLGGLGSMYLNNQGTKAAIAGQDQAQELIRQATAADLENIGKIEDSQADLAYRKLGTQQIADRATMGMTPEDIAELQKVNRQSAQQFKANNATIGQDMQRRGMANSGLGLAQSMSAAEQALQNQALAGQNQAAQSFAMKQNAATNLANMSNTALTNDYNRQMGKAQNLSAVNRFNAQQQGTAAANKGTIQQGAKTVQGQGVQDIAKGVIGQGWFDKEKKV